MYNATAHVAKRLLARNAWKIVLAYLTGDCYLECLVSCDAWHQVGWWLLCCLPGDFYLACLVSYNAWHQASKWLPCCLPGDCNLECLVSCNAWHQASKWLPCCLPGDCYLECLVSCNARRQAGKWLFAWSTDTNQKRVTTRRPDYSRYFDQMRHRILD